MSKKIKVLIVDDSAVVRKILTEIFSEDPEIEVVGTAPDPLIARDKIKQLHPDVITLDIEMPKMDGVTFLRNLMRLHPMPVVMISSLTEDGADITLEALQIGAVDFVPKPKFDVQKGLTEYASLICEKVKMAARAHVRSHPETPLKSPPQKHSADAVLAKTDKAISFRTTELLIAIGASTGGTEAIAEVMQDLPSDCPSIVITQHIPEAFSESCAKRLNNNSAITVMQAVDGQQIIPGHAYVAPGGKHLLVKRSGARFICQLNDGELVNRHKPSVDVMFRSVAQNLGQNAIGVILTGMGDDGAQGLAEMHDRGSPTIAQDEASSVVWGMPGEAVKTGKVDDVLPLEQVAARIMALVRKRR